MLWLGFSHKKWDLSNQQSIHLIWNLTCLLFLFEFTLLKSIIRATGENQLAGRHPTGYHLPPTNFKNIIKCICFLTWDIHVISFLTGFNVNKYARTSLVLIHSWGMEAAPAKKWAFFIYSRLMSPSCPALGELRITDNPKHQQEVKFLLQVWITQIVITHFPLHPLVQKIGAENWWKVV